MLFVTHMLAAGLLSRLSRLSPWWLVIGAAAPDLLDKPLAMAEVTSLYHAVGHSALLLLVVLPVALSGLAGRAAAVGWVSHLSLDAFHILLNGRPGDVVFLAWPLVHPADPLALPPGSFLRYYIGTPSFYVELLLWGGVLLLGLRQWQPNGSRTSEPR
jgi:hypothetical protein